jgi:hypothetical protein
MCHLEITLYLFCGHWRYNLQPCDIPIRALCDKTTRDGALHDVCPQCRSLSTPRRLGEIKLCGGQFCDYLLLMEQRKVSDGPRDSRSGNTLHHVAGVVAMLTVRVVRQHQYSEGREWKAYRPPTEPDRNVRNENRG